MSKVKLKELLEIKNGKDYKGLGHGDIPVYGSGGLMLYVDDYIYDDESILLPRKGTLDNIMYCNGKFWTVDTMYWTKINKDLAYPKYLYFYLSLLDLSCRDSGSTLPSMTFDSYYTLDIELPDMSTQKMIGDYCFLLNSKIENNNAIIAELESMAKTINDYWFLQFEFPDENGKPYKSSGGKMVWNDELKREIPEGWEVGNIKDCIKHINTGLNPRDNFKLGDGNIKYITVKNLTTDGSIDFSNCDLINEKAREIVHNRSDVSKNDILFASIAPLGRCAIVYENPKDWDINESVFSIRPDLNKVSPEYLYLYFMSEYFVKKAEHSSTGSVFSGIRVGILEEMKILIPNKKMMDKFTKSVYELLFTKYKNLEQNQELASLRDWLLPMLMNGQVKFKEGYDSMFTKHEEGCC